VISVLDNIWIDTLITDPLANSFWKQKDFLGEYSASWKKFSAAFCDFLISPNDVDYTLKDIKYRCLEKIVSTENKIPGVDEIVTLEQFAHVINWFGQISPNDTEREDFLETMQKILQEHWFWGYISADDAENLLQLAQDLQFLVRASKSEPTQPFTLSYLTITIKNGILKKKFNHLRIDKVVGGFGTEMKNPDGSKIYISDTTLIQIIDKLKIKLNLSTPILCSKYVALFSPKGKSKYANLLKKE